MTEDFLHYLWKFQYFHQKNLQTQLGEPIEILKIGTYNTDAGPDFFNSKIKIGNTVWAGNIEVHINSSDWKKHNHHADKGYDNIILHLVFNDDKIIFRNNGEPLPTLELKDKIDLFLFEKYQNLIENKYWIPCEKQISEVDKFAINNWLERLLIERLERKSAAIIETLKLNKNNWQETFYQHLAKNFGFKLNAAPFELLAKSTPLAYLGKHKNSLTQIEAMLFGQAGMLSPTPSRPKSTGLLVSEREGEKLPDDYRVQLQKEYLFLKQKFNLTPIDAHLWKFLRLRPVNFPTIRLAQFAQLIYKSESLFSKVINCSNIDELYDLFELKTSEYWQTHYLFDKISPKKIKNFGKNSVDIILINTIIPFIFVHGKEKGEEQFCDRAISFLEKINGENNAIIKNWKSLKMPVNTAYQTQALLELKHNYCDKKRCLNCNIGNNILKK